MYPVLLLANRDESYARGFVPPSLIDAERGILAPLDKQAGGTWLGVNRAGVVAAITNADPEPRRQGVKSRGELVRLALERDSAREAGHAIANHLLHTRYASFNLLVVDRSDAVTYRYRAADDPAVWPDSSVSRLAPGAHVITNLHEPGSLAVPKVAEVGPDQALDDVFAAYAVVAADDRTELPGGHRILKRARDRGTVCSGLVAVGGRNGEAPVFRFADGVPGIAPYEPVPWPA